MTLEAIAIDDDVIENGAQSFYGRIQHDTLIGLIFEERIHDWEPHLQRMLAFWSSVILLSRRYDGRPMPKHGVLPIDAYHFDRWLEIFKNTVLKTQ
ncbi:group III truncated hemoglobin [Bartonella tamiae]|uniref:Group III truncated hemoglobin n=1 Tax=Bartonella tamiae Th239 TaxID=1094558 RepID=J1JYV1_9HYPH|nr:group III truncated hemoglobin [Bartonella tamiae]EJF90277.1 hypothetical protein ME5_00678 [Bartonella tamiae Th239]EJF93782.1 hypothetical protein MEG_01206 [Bartonella tamiae Th307]